MNSSTDWIRGDMLVIASRTRREGRLDGVRVLPAPVVLLRLAALSEPGR